MESESEKKPRVGASVLAFLSGAVTLGFLAWLCWTITRLLSGGVPEADIAGLVETLAIAATGVVVSAAVAARTTDASPFTFLSGLFVAIRNMVRR